VSESEILLLLSPSLAAPDLGAPHCSETQGETPLADTGSHFEVDCAELKRIPVNYYGSNWYEQILRMYQKEKLPKILSNYKLEGHRGTGISKTRWKDELN
jgi:hypothetical protein